MDDVTCVRWPPPNYLYFIIGSNFTSKIRCHIIFLNPIGSLILLSRNLKVTSEFFVSFLVDLAKSLLLLVISSSIVSSYVSGISNPNLIFFLTHIAPLIIITFLFLRSDGAHHSNVGYLSILFAFDYSTISTGFVSFISLRFMYEVFPESHSTLSCHTSVVIAILLTSVIVSSYTLYLGI